MPILIVVNDPKEWSLEIPGVEVVDARSYLTKPAYSDMRGVKLFNLCRSYRYQSTGYYVSLLAQARGHRPLPSILTIQDLKSPTLVRLASEDLDDLIQHSLAALQSETFTLSIYFGRNLAKRYERLSLHLFNLFQAPLLRAQFSKQRKWQLKSVAAISANEIPTSHHDFVATVAAEHFAGRRAKLPKRAPARYDIAILHDPEDPEPPSDEKALRYFAKAAAALGLSAELITRDDYARIAEFDGLFIRDTTNVNHYTYRFSRRAASEGLVVIDDPESIVRCTNKVYLAEVMDRYDVPTPRTLVVHRGNARTVGETLGFPCVLKKPDSAFSLGVVKAETADDLARHLDEFLEKSDLVVAQEFLPTTFDWRIGIIDGRPLYACKYFMARNHWQIIKGNSEGQLSYGRYETLPVELAPRRAVRTALRAANLFGDGLYGVDVKQSGNQFYIIEVNDNPSIEAGVEDAILREELYRRIMGVFLERIERRKSAARPA